MFPSQCEQTVETSPLDMEGLTENLTRLLLRLVPGVIVLLLNMFLIKTIRYQYTIDQIGLHVVLNDEIVCFTDGSRLEHTCRTGASVFIELHNIKQVVPLGHYATVFQAEVYAIRIYVSYLCDECFYRNILGQPSSTQGLSRG